MHHAIADLRHDFFFSVGQRTVGTDCYKVRLIASLRFHNTTKGSAGAKCLGIVITRQNCILATKAVSILGCYCRQVHRPALETDPVHSIYSGSVPLIPLQGTFSTILMAGSTGARSSSHIEMFSGVSSLLFVQPAHSNTVVDVRSEHLSLSRLLYHGALQFVASCGPSPLFLLSFSSLGLVSQEQRPYTEKSTVGS